MGLSPCHEQDITPKRKPIHAQIMPKSICLKPKARSKRQILYISEDLLRISVHKSLVVVGSPDIALPGESPEPPCSDGSPGAFEILPDVQLNCLTQQQGGAAFAAWDNLPTKWVKKKKTKVSVLQNADSILNNLSDLSFN